MEAMVDWQIETNAKVCSSLRYGPSIGNLGGAFSQTMWQRLSIAQSVVFSSPGCQISIQGPDWRHNKFTISGWREAKKPRWFFIFLLSERLGTLFHCALIALRIELIGKSNKFNFDKLVLCAGFHVFFPFCPSSFALSSRLISLRFPH